jgi:hypothetical protein
MESGKFRYKHRLSSFADTDKVNRSDSYPRSFAMERKNRDKKTERN